MHPSEATSPAAAADGGIVAAIPARYGSSRLPGKPLLHIAGRPMVQHVYERVRRAAGLDRVVVLTDDERIVKVVEGFGGEVELTPVECTSGTDRIASALARWPRVAAVVNVQGDEPLIDPAAVETIARHLGEHPEDPMVTLAVPAAEHELEEASAVKVVCDLAGRALYFSRARIPFPRHGNAPAVRPWKHVGIYGYQRAALLRMAALAPSPLEEVESLEQLRALENGIAIRVLTGGRPSPGVDTREDLERVEEIMRQGD